MANTYTQIYIHIVFAVQGRQNLIRREHNDELQKYLTGIVSGRGQKLIAINNMPDHFYILSARDRTSRCPIWFITSKHDRPASSTIVGGGRQVPLPQPAPLHK
jgi:REP element-mobilizing transposase RayT